MAINKNHEFEELNGVKCGIVEKNVKTDRVAFLKELLELNGYEVIVAASPLPKLAPTPKPVEPQTSNLEPQTSNLEPKTSNLEPQTFTVGVSDYTFNPINAIFGRLLKTRDGQIVTLAYWNQEVAVNNDEIPYYEKE